MKPGRIVTSAATVVAFVLVLAVAVSSLIQTNNLIFLPAPAEAIDSHITVAGHPRQPHRGSLYITFVEEPQATLLMTIWESFNPEATIVPLPQYYGNNVPPPAQRQQQSIAEMIDSKTEAELAAFQALGYHPKLSEHVAVSGLTKQSKAAGKLQVNDVILEANGQAVHTPQELKQVVQRLRPGAPIALLVSRPSASGTNDSKTFRLTVPTINLAGKAAIGIMLLTTVTAQLPYAVKIDSGDIGGPSAGLMFALGIINRFSPVDLTHGYKIAGTGTIDPVGNVGPIGGVKQKLIGAREAGARYFLVPTLDNYAEARPFAKGITLVPVATLGDALAFLRRLR